MKAGNDHENRRKIEIYVRIHAVRADDGLRGAGRRVRKGISAGSRWYLGRVAERERSDRVTGERPPAEREPRVHRGKLAERMLRLCRTFVLLERKISPGPPSKNFRQKKKGIF